MTSLSRKCWLTQDRFEIVWVDPGPDLKQIESSMSPTKALEIEREIAKKMVAEGKIVADTRSDVDALLDFICVQWADVREKDEANRRKR